MTADDGAAARIAGKGEKLRKQTGGKDRGIAPACPHARTGRRRPLLIPERNQEDVDTFRSQIGLIAHGEQHPRQIRHGPRPRRIEAETLPGVGVAQREKAGHLRQRKDPGIGASRPPRGKTGRGDGREGAAYQRRPSQSASSLLEPKRRPAPEASSTAPTLIARMGEGPRRT